MESIIYNLIYVFVIDPDFLANYAEHTIAEKSVGKSGEELAQIRKDILDEQKTFENPVLQFIIMFLSVFVMGTIVSLVSGFFLKKEKVA